MKNIEPNQYKPFIKLERNQTLFENTKNFATNDSLLYLPIIHVQTSSEYHSTIYLTIMHAAKISAKETMT
mgnify:CR=1 FL=1